MTIYRFFSILFNTTMAVLSSDIPHIHDMMALAVMPSDWVNPATANVTNDTPATVMA